MIQLLRHFLRLQQFCQIHLLVEEEAQTQTMLALTIATDYHHRHHHHYQQVRQIAAVLQLQPLVQLFSVCRIESGARLTLSPLLKRDT